MAESEVVLDSEVCRLRFSQVIKTGFGPIRKIEISGGRCTMHGVQQRELDNWNRAHGGYFGSYAYSVESWGNRVMREFLRLTDKPRITFFVVLHEGDVRIYTTKSDAMS